MAKTLVDFDVYKLTSPPAVWEKNGIYFVASPETGIMELYHTSTTGVPRRLPTKADIVSLIAAQFTALNTTKVVSTITQRNALNPTTTTSVYVEDATGDTTVKSGGATYMYDSVGAKWIKLSEAESMDISFSWDSIIGKPNSTPTQIDNAVTASHTHSNISTLNKLSEDAKGNLSINGIPVGAAYAQIDW